MYNLLKPGKTPRRSPPPSPEILRDAFEAKAALAARHQGPFCEHTNYDREYCSLPAEHTERGPRCKRHSLSVGFTVERY
jgi:hypothetical protein